MSKNQLLDWYARHLWPLVRLMVRKSRRCRRCILSERYAPLRDGLCPECAGAAARVALKGSDQVALRASAADPALRARFDTTMRACRNPAGRYDALVLVSGGKDSAYLLDRLRRDYPELRLLCVVVNNGFMSPFAIPGACHVAAKCRADLLVASGHVDEFARILRGAFLDLDGRGSYGVIDHADGETIFRIGRQIATELGIPNVIAGLSWVQVERILRSQDFELMQDGRRLIFPLAVWRTDEQEIRRVVRERELLLPGGDSPIVSNSDLILSMAVLDIKQLGYSSFEPEFAQLVREGKTDRRTWLHLFEMIEFAVTRGYLDRDLSRALGRLNLEVKDVMREAA